MVRIGGPKSGDGTVNSEMPTMSSTAIAACDGADDGAAEREDAPIGRDHANLRQHIDAEQAGDAKGDLGEPISERRPDVAVEAELVTDGEKLRQIAGRRGVEQHRHREPDRGLRQRRRPKYQQRARADRFDVKRNEKHLQEKPGLAGTGCIIAK